MGLHVSPRNTLFTCPIIALFGSNDMVAGHCRHHLNNLFICPRRWRLRGLPVGSAKHCRWPRAQIRRDGRYGSRVFSSYRAVRQKSVRRVWARRRCLLEHGNWYDILKHEKILTSGISHVLLQQTWIDLSAFANLVGLVPRSIEELSPHRTIFVDTSCAWRQAWASHNRGASTFGRSCL
jgi:hypothetical protein